MTGNVRRCQARCLRHGETKSLIPDNDSSENFTMNADNRQIVPGISVSAAGQATVDPAVSDVLFDLALILEESTDLPVDVEHVLAAIVLAAKKGQLQQNTSLTANDPTLQRTLIPHVKTVFEVFGGQLGTDD